MVTYLNSTHKVTFFGDTFAGNEEWSTSLWLGNASGGDTGADPTQAQADAIAALWETFFENSTTGITSYFNTLGVKVALVSTAGVSNPGSTVFSYYPTAIVGGAGSVSTFPPQISLVATLTTAKPRGAGSKGRMFLPGVKHPIDATGHLISANVLTVRDNLKTLLDGINALPAVGGVTHEVVLNSALAPGIPGHPATMTPITGVRIGNVYDTQRRRRNQLVETYSSVALA